MTGWKPIPLDAQGMINLLLAAILSSIVVDVSLSNGQQLSGELKSLSSDAVSVLVDPGPNGQRRIARAGIKEIQFAKPAGRAVVPKMRLELSCGSVIPCQSVTLSDGQLKVDEASPFSWASDSKVARTVRWPQPKDNAEQWEEIFSKAGADDLLVIRRQSLDYLKGVVLGITNDAVQFQYSGNTIPVPLAKVAGVIFSVTPEEVPEARMFLTTHDGGRWALQDATLAGDALALTTATGVDAKLPVTEVSSLGFVQVGAVYLTDLEPSSFSVKPFFGSPSLSKTLASLNAPRFDVAFDGLPLRIASENSNDGWQEFERGIAMQSRSEIVYRLAGKYQRFMTTAGVAFGSPSQADVELKLLADEREIYAKSIRSGDAPLQIDVDVSKARRLKVLVDYGKHAHIGDRLHLGDARLLK